MFQKLKLRTKLVAIVAPPLFVLAVVAAYSVLLSNQGAGSIEELSDDIRTLGVVALAAFLLSALTVVVIGRTISDPIDDLSAAARELADDRLPALLDSLRNPGAEEPTFEPLTGGNNDELAKLVESLNAIQEGVAGIAVEQREIVRQGLSELVVNLARRNQSLLDRQIEVIDALESDEEDPDRLQELFTLDHLSTRMRRNAESLLVVAGAEPARRRGSPVEIADTLRVAMSEIEDYRHVKLVNIEEAKIGAQSAVDLAHLFSEVLENATQFSPPDSPVEVTGVMHPEGSYLISCVDHGIGMTTEQLALANDVLQHPPELGLGLTRSLGFIVVGRLSKRLGVTVELTHTPDGGITAIAEVPAELLSGATLPPAATEASAPAPTHAEAAPIEAAPSDAAPVPAAAVAPAPSLSEDAFAPSFDTDQGESWTPPAMPERGAAPFGEAAPFSADAPVADAPPAATPVADTPPMPGPADGDIPAFQGIPDFGTPGPAVAEAPSATEPAVPFEAAPSVAAPSDAGP